MAQYDSAGNALKTVDPAGREHRQFFDAVGRVTKTVQNYVDGVVSAAVQDEDVTIEMAYTADGALQTLTAKNPSTGDQVTRYVYGTTLTESGIARSDLLRAEIYPDSDDTESPLGNGADGLYDRVEYTYNRQGEVLTKKDQNGTVHEFAHDRLGRQTADKVTALASAVDGTVRRIEQAYEVRGMVARITSFDAATGGNAVNEVLFEYNDLGLPVGEYQEHAGAKGASTPYVGYSYDTSAASGQFTKGARLATIRYPNSRIVHYTYGASGGTGDAMDRIAAISEDSGGVPGSAMAEYGYLGRSAIVQVDYPEPQLRYDLAHGTGSDPYAGLDRFGRVTDLVWRDYGSSADAVRIKHGYDRAGNRLWREDPVAASYGKHFDELYGYDRVNQLVSFQRGDLNASKTGLNSGMTNFAQGWTLDMTGNWRAFLEDSDGNGSWDLNQSRTANAVNEVSDIGETAGPAWITPQYDRAGNMTTVPKPANPTVAFTASYDAWNRLVRLADGTSTVAEYAYDGAKRRTVKKAYTGGQPTETRHFYYSRQWQVLEERVGASTAAERQFVWGLRYIDDLVLRDRDTDSNASLDERLYALQDPNWNVTAIAAPDGAIQERYAYDAYGVPSILTPSFVARSASAFAWETRYAGYRWDAEALLYHVRHRVLAPGLGWVQRDSALYRGGASLYQYAADDPMNAVDPAGLWRFVPGMGTLSGSLGPGDESSYGKASSDFDLRFDRDSKAFSTNGTGPCCSQIKFIQIFYMNSTALVNALPNRRWTIDSDSPPYYPYGSFFDPSNPLSIGSTMIDGPYFRWLWQYSRPGVISMDFEACAICSRSKAPGGKKGVGDVFACVRWGHSFNIAGSVFNAHVTTWKRYVGFDVWTSHRPLGGGSPGTKSQTLWFKGLAEPPSEQMKQFLNRYFP